MLPSVQAVVEKDGRIRPLEPIHVREGTPAIITFLTEQDEATLHDAAILSEGSLSDWNRPEEDKAWEYLQEAQ